MSHRAHQFNTRGPATFSQRASKADLAVRNWRRGRDSNPRTPFRMLLTFQASAFDHSATSPRETSNLRGPARVPEAAGVIKF